MHTWAIAVATALLPAGAGDVGAGDGGADDGGDTGGVGDEACSAVVRHEYV